MGFKPRAVLPPSLSSFCCSALSWGRRCRGWGIKLLECDQRHFSTLEVWRLWQRYLSLTGHPCSFHISLSPKVYVTSSGQGTMDRDNGVTSGLSKAERVRVLQGLSSPGIATRESRWSETELPAHMEGRTDPCVKPLDFRVNLLLQHNSQS